MDSKEFKNKFGKIANLNGFESAFGGWIMESVECIVVLELQKSNFGDYFQLNIKGYIQGVFGQIYSKNKDIVKKDVGDIRNGEPREYREIFRFDNFIEDAEREGKLNKLFIEFILPFTKMILSKAGIKELANKGEIYLLPAVKKELDKLSN